MSNLFDPIEEIFSCSKCSAEFSTEYELSIHMKTHRKPRSTSRPKSQGIQKEEVETIIQKEFAKFMESVKDIIKPPSQSIEVPETYIPLNLLMLKHLNTSEVLTDNDLFEKIKGSKRSSITSGRTNLVKRKLVESAGKINELLVWKITQLGKDFLEAEMDKIIKSL